MELFVSGKKFCEYTIERVMSHKYPYRTVYSVSGGEKRRSTLIVYDMDAYDGMRYSLLDMKVPAEFYYAYHLQKEVSPEVYKIARTHLHGNYCWMSQEYFDGVELEFYSTVIGLGDWSVKEYFALDLCIMICKMEELLPQYFHLRLTPENILAEKVGEDRMKPILIGLDQIVRFDMPGVLHPDNTKGLKYCAPELLMGFCPDNSHVYTIAMIIFELLVGSLPWDIDKWQPESSFRKSKASLNALRREEPKLEWLPEPLREVFRKALAKHTKRYKSIQV